MYWGGAHGIRAEIRSLIMRAQELRIALADGARLREELQAIAELSQQREEATAPECSQISGPLQGL